MITAVAPFLAFHGRAREALDLYRDALGGHIEGLSLYEEGEEGTAGTVRLAILVVAGTRMRLIDITTDDFAFSPAMSVFLEANSSADVDRLAEQLGADGSQLMPVGAYDFADRFVWLEDRFGVNWQIIYAGTAEFP